MPGPATSSLSQFPPEFLKGQCTETSVLGSMAVHTINMFLFLFFHNFMAFWVSVKFCFS